MKMNLNQDLKVNRHFFDQINLGCGGVIVTAVGNKADFVSRFFTPQATIWKIRLGSAHCTLTFLGNRLSKKLKTFKFLTEEDNYFVKTGK